MTLMNIDSKIIDNKIQALKIQFENIVSIFSNNTTSIFDEICLIKNTLIKQSELLASEIDSIQKEREEIKEFKKVSLILSLNKQVKHRDNRIEILERQIELYKKNAENLATIYGNSNENNSENNEKINVSKNNVENNVENNVQSPIEESDYEEIEVEKIKIGKKKYYVSSDSSRSIYKVKKTTDNKGNISHDIGKLLGNLDESGKPIWLQTK